eukprot:5425650-Amphidinium_carterae.1
MESAKTTKSFEIIQNIINTTKPKRCNVNRANINTTVFSNRGFLNAALCVLRAPPTKAHYQVKLWTLMRRLQHATCRRTT